MRSLSKFFEENIGNIDISEESEGSEKTDKFGVAIINSDDFGENNPKITKFLLKFRKNITSGQHNSRKIICKAEDKNDIVCEATFDKKLGNINFRNILVRFQDMDHVKIYTDSVDKEEETLVI